MRKMMMTALAAGLLAGCATVEKTSPGMMDGLDVVGGKSPAESTVVVRNSGFGIFYLWTAVCGDVRYSTKHHRVNGGLTFFDDQCNTSDCYRALQRMAHDRHRELTNVNMVDNSLPNQGFAGWVGLAGWFIESQDVVCSGVLRKQVQK